MMMMMMMTNRNANNNNNNNNNKTSYRQRHKKYNNGATILSRQQMIVVFLLAIAIAVSNNNNEWIPMRGILGRGGGVFLVVHAQSIDYTCYPMRDYGNNNNCPTLDNKKCDDPNLNPSTGNIDCLNQDCIDCNSYCQNFDYDCYGCLGATGCYYCEGDGTCQNSDMYTSSNKQLSCTTPSEYLLGGQDDPATSCIAPTSLTQDPLNGANDWMFDMIDLNKVREQLKVTGKGIKIRINDDGVDINNPDLQGTNKFDETNSCDQWQPNTNDGDGHGTTVAGIIVGTANNDFCSAGIAYEATFSACNFFAPGVPYSNLAYKVDTFDISQNSIGSPACSAGDIQGERRELQQDGSSCPFTVPTEVEKDDDPCDPTICNYQQTISTPCENAITQYCKNYYRIDGNACADFNDLILGDNASCDYDKLPNSAIAALATGVQEGRAGKGTIFVFASGNAFSEGDDINFSGWTNSRYTITVGAVGKDGKHTDYSTPGAALTVVGPAGDSDDASHIISTGLDGSCVDSGPGTSFACPVVSGVIALMLEARSELTWRDVQGIIVSTSTTVTDSQDTSAATNSAGFWHSDWYGFGIINAFQAVEAALAWELWTPEQQAIGESQEENAVISNAGAEFISTLTIGSDDYPGFVAESVVVLVDLQHYNRGDLQLTLISPQGTHSILHAGKRPENSQLAEEERWKLMTVKNWGEDPVGTWQLKLQDRVVVDGTAANTDNNNFRQWKITIYGRSENDVGVVDPIIISPTTAPTFAVAITAPPINVIIPPTTAPTKAVVITAPPTNVIIPPTNAPTKAIVITAPPTNVPTNSVIAPTRSPTRPPTRSPTNNPTKPPTKNPTSPPTRSPTKNPTQPPNPDSTRKPTREPTTKPTRAPTKKPSRKPTTQPTPKPTAQPTSKPTAKPTEPPFPGSTPPPTPSPTTTEPSTSAAPSVSERPSATSPANPLTPPVPPPVPPPVLLAPVPSPVLPPGPTSVIIAPSVTSPTGVLDPSVLVVPAPTLPTGPLLPAPTPVVGTPSALVPSSVHVPPGKSSLTPPHLNPYVQNVQRPSSSSSLPQGPGSNANTGTIPILSASASASASATTTSTTNTVIGKSDPATTTTTTANAIPQTSATTIAATNPNNVIRPTTISTGLQKMGEVETESVEDLSIVLEGVNGDIPASTLTLIQTVLEEHTNTVVSRLFPTIHFHSTIRIVLASPNNNKATRKRNLRLLLDQQQQQQEALHPQPSVTIQYNELIKFKRLYGMEDLNGNTLASLALQTPDDREEFVNKIHHKLNDDPVLQSIVSVSEVELPPTISPSSSPTSASPLAAPTTRKESNNEQDNDGHGWITPEHLQFTNNEEEEEEEIQKDPLPLSMIIVYFCLVSSGVVLVVGAIAAIVRRRKLIHSMEKEATNISCTL